MDQRPQHTLDLMKEKEWNSFEFFGTGEDFLNWTPVAQALKSAINK